MQIEQIQAQPFHLRVTIPADYLDVFGHMNVQYYLKIFSDSVFEMCAQFGMDEAYFLRSGHGMYALEQHIKYLAEVREGETVAIHSRYFGRNERRIHFMLFMVNETRQNIAATIEVMALHVDRETKRAIAFAPEFQAAMDARILQDRALDWQAPHSKPLAI